ncbi:dual specificity protein phosphatase [Paenibacillus sp. BSR1-1]|uniref:dual specificity protein phosphatase family protein n=1 Tax=Paenibacillus sp. BSR1-1 TaxID=3020845 RepID=UPI0025AF58D9|nr:dual specificity protein phosphatase [Paenibacillus sp. BSR1-1]MDN3019939.1 dual specificity protein phosphatase [Paenibacillus sp. BSR1-1]
MDHQPPNWIDKYGHSEIINGLLFLGGEDDIDDLLYGKEESRNLNGNGFFQTMPTPQIDVWIDLRDVRDSNRNVFLPENVEYISVPFRDGVIEEAKTYLPIAKEILGKKLANKKRVLVTCHQGRSRSVMLLVWYLSETMGTFDKAYKLIRSKRPIINPDKNFIPLLEEWKLKYTPNN